MVFPCLGFHHLMEHLDLRQEDGLEVEELVVVLVVMVVVSNRVQWIVSLVEQVVVLSLIHI